MQACKEPPSNSSVANEGFAPLCGAAAISMAALKTPVAYNGQWVATLKIYQKSISKSLKNYQLFIYEYRNLAQV